MKCPKSGCGKEVTGRFCGHCGTKITTNTHVSTIGRNEIICSGKFDDGTTCGSIVTIGQRFCDHCGNQIEYPSHEAVSCKTCIGNNVCTCGEVVQLADVSANGDSTCANIFGVTSPNDQQQTTGLPPQGQSVIDRISDVSLNDDLKCVNTDGGISQNDEQHTNTMPSQCQTATQRLPDISPNSSCVENDRGTSPNDKQQTTYLQRQTQSDADKIKDVSPNGGSTCVNIDGGIVPNDQQRTTGLPPQGQCGIDRISDVSRNIDSTCVNTDRGTSPKDQQQTPCLQPQGQSTTDRISELIKNDVEDRWEKEYAICDADESMGLGERAHGQGSLEASMNGDAPNKESECANKSVNLDEATVIFHVLVKADVINEARLTIVFHNNGSSYCSSKSSQLESYCEFTVEKRLPKRCLLESLTYYTYCFEQDKKGQDEKISHPEKYRKQSPNKDNPTRNGTTMRQLYVSPNSFEGKDVWHQYDGIVAPSSKFYIKNSIVKLLNRSEKLKRKREKAKIYFKYFVPRLFQEPLFDMIGIQESIDDFMMLTRGFRRVYFEDLKYWTDYKKMETKVIGAQLSQVVESIVEKTSQQSSTSRIVQSLSIAVACHIILIKKLPKSTWQHLCECLIPTVDESNGCVEWSVVCEHFDQTQLSDALTGLSIMHLEDKDPSWMYCVPLLHLSSGVCKPFEEPNCLDHDTTELKWWGIDTRLKPLVEMFRSDEKTCIIPLKNVIGKLQSIFKMDFLLPRTIVHSLNANELETLLEAWVPVEVVCAALIYSLKLSCFSETQTNVDHAIAMTMTCLQTTASPEARPLTHWDMTYKIAYQLVEESFGVEVINNNDRWRTSLQCINILVHCIVLYDCSANKTTTQTQPTSHRSNDHLSYIEIVAEKCLNWLRKEQVTEIYFKKWSFTLFDDFESNAILKRWNDTFSQQFIEDAEEKCKQSIHVSEEVLRHCCNSLDSYTRPFQMCLKKIALKIVENESCTLTFESLPKKEKGRYLLILAEIFERRWSENTENIEPLRILKTVLTWMHMDQFIELIDKSEPQCLESVSRIRTLLNETWESIQDGSVEVEILECVIEHSKRFCEMQKSVLEKNASEIKDAERLIHLRKKEIEAFRAQFQLMTDFMSMCSKCTVDIRRNWHILQTNFVKYRLKEFCDSHMAHLVQKHDEYVPDILVFKEFKSILDILQEFKECYYTAMFQRWFDNYRQHITIDNITVDEIVDKLWSPIYSRWLQFLLDMTTGELSFNELEPIVGSVSDGDEKLRTDLTDCDVSNDIARTRIEQFKHIRQLRTCKEDALAVLQFKDQHMLQGNFDPIIKIAAMTDSCFKLNECDDKLMTICQILMGVTQEKRKCLNTFTECKELVKWVQDTMNKSGRKELKVFIDLAMMSVGDDPMTVGKVQSLHSALIGYSTLIFELKPSTDYEQLLEMCTCVWNELQVNPKLTEQLADTNRALPWLKEVKKAHGSVEVTSLSQVDTINSCGIFSVTMNESHGKTYTKNTTAEVINLTTTEPLKRYTFAQLQDLQSRVMLVAGNTSNERETVVGVERFTTILDSVTRLGNALIRICEFGCGLFSGWAGQFWCDQQRPVCIEISFGDQFPEIKVRGTSAEKAIPKISKFIEDCLQEWLHYVKIMRSKHYYLNYYTLDQLFILERECGKRGRPAPPISHLVYPLLFAVKQECTPDDLARALGRALAFVRIEIKSKTETSVIYNDSNELHSKINTFVNKLIGLGYSQLLSEEALNHVDVKDIHSGHMTKAILWCMGQGKDYEKNVECKSPTETVEATDLKAVYQANEIGVEPVIKALETIWKNFLDSLTSNVSDVLSLEHLGSMLKYLAEQEECNVVKRKCKEIYKEGEPNLIVCSEDEVLGTVLSIYMFDKDKPLPSSDEVLLCNSDTTSEEVEIFLRRAIFGNGSKIYCLMHPEKLGHGVSEAADQSLQDFAFNEKHDKGHIYRLIIICSANYEYRCPLVSSLDKYIRYEQFVQLDEVKAYVRDKFIVHQDDAFSLHKDSFSVRIVKSKHAGVGKSLFVTRQAELLQESLSTSLTKVSLQVLEKHINPHELIQSLLAHTLEPGLKMARLFHINISHEVQGGIDFLLFNLLILGCLVDNNGYVWRKNAEDLYLVETMPIISRHTGTRGTCKKYADPILNILPDVMCRSPQESLHIYRGPSEYNSTDQLFDEKQFKSEEYQRTYQYLHRFQMNKRLSDINPAKTEGDRQSCLDILLRCCGVNNPTWSELHHFVLFLNKQLVDFKQNQFVSSAASSDLPGFATFVLRFLLQMSKDFATRSLYISEESPGTEPDECESDLMDKFSMKRTWENSPHPYLFFNSDHQTFTFLGFYIDPSTGNMIDRNTSTVLDTAIMDKMLYDALLSNHVPLRENFDDLDRKTKLRKLHSVMGNTFDCDPDETFILTAENAMKMLAIYMRFRCDIPVIIMGETGCGKTRLMQFMCALQNPQHAQLRSMIHMKIHGGTKKEDIKRYVHAAEKQAQLNIKTYGKHICTVLFFDEANSTEAIGTIKEILCDHTVFGEPLQLCKNLKFVAACNPYRKHPNELIQKLEQAGLGYHVDAEETTDRLGRVPMRHLVYRVQPLPLSLLPFVWDFGQLNKEAENKYIRQMVQRHAEDEELTNKSGVIDVISNVLSVSQQFMRDQKDECSFVSLRDVERALMVMTWFRKHFGPKFLFDAMARKLQPATDRKSNNPSGEAGDQLCHHKTLDTWTRSLVLALGVCYHARIKSRSTYRDTVATAFDDPCPLPGKAGQMLEEIECCQDVFLDDIQLDENIAKNTALKENVFMMVVCIELRIPLFLVGKPGSSKSLAKTIVADAMQGNCSKFPLFKQLKQIHMISYQCSPLSTPDGIVGVFKQCADFQKDKDLDTFVSVVVLDEVGLAEDSPRMPLKALHPLLEDGFQGEDIPEQYKKVAFIGISNWSLDPAKVNRGLIVQREIPDIEDLVNSARGICGMNDEVRSQIEPFFKPLTLAYLDVFEDASKTLREFYGLRDFYSLMKMIYAFVKKSKEAPTWLQILHSVKRNFGGLEKVYPEERFWNHLGPLLKCDKAPTGPDCSSSGVIKACFLDSQNLESACRYLLLMTESYGALSIIQQKLFTENISNQITIFGSSFRDDQKYTQVCRNINKIKVCMETGKTVVLLNLENLYESLYDALNQYYVNFGGERYVDLGLGTHRVKCPVHKKFRLIVVAEKNTVYKTFPIPLINRLEKHLLIIKDMLDERQKQLAAELQTWAKRFSAELSENCGSMHKQPKRQIGDAFIGFQEDTCSAIIMHIFEAKLSDEEIIEKGKQLLLWCATPESFVLNNELDVTEKSNAIHYYYEKQAHGSLIQYLQYKLKNEWCEPMFAQITCHSKLLAVPHKYHILQKVPDLKYAEIISLLSFDTEQQFTNHVRRHLRSTGANASLLVVQCESGDVNSKLIACARHCAMEEVATAGTHRQARVFIAFIVQLPRKAGGCFTDFQCGVWHSVHIDDLYAEYSALPQIQKIQGMPVSEIFSKYMFDQNASIVNVKLLLRSCIQPALSMIKNSTRSKQRETERIDIVCRLFCNDNASPVQEAFTMGIINWIVKLLEEKEIERQDNPKLWLAKQSAGIENINKHGTFRRSFCGSLMANVTPVLTAIFTFIDTNSNMDLVDSDEEWKREYFFNCLRRNDTLPLKYNDCLPSLKSAMPFDEMLVVGTGCEGRDFKVRFPFSWVLINKLEAVFCDFATDLKNAEGEITKCVTLLKSIPMGNILFELEHASDKKLFVELDFIHDYVHTFYNTANDTEFKIVFDAVWFQSKNILDITKSRDILHRIVCARLAWNEVSVSLTHFRCINNVWPKCSDTINEMIKCDSNDFHFRECGCISSALCLLINDLNPKHQELDNPNTRQEWLNRVYLYRPVVEANLNDSRTGLHPLSKQIAKSLWSRVITMKLFLEIVCNTTSERDITIEYCMPLWELLGDCTDFGNTESLNGIEQFLQHCNRTAKKELLGPGSICGKCRRILDRKPVSMPCKANDRICQKCVNEMVSDPNKCPICKEQISPQWKPDTKEPEESRRIEIEKFEQYQKRCNTFFLEVVSQLSFANGIAPSDKVLQLLLSYITFRSESGMFFTKDMNIFETGLKPIPVFRSFLLRLILKSGKEAFVEKQLSHFFEKPNQDDAGNSKDVIDMYMLIVQCWEDRQFQRLVHSEESTIRDACDLLTTSLDIVVKKESKIIETLHALGNMRACFAITAERLHAISEANLKMNGEDKTLFETAEKVCNLVHSDNPKLYLVKLLCRQYSIDIYRRISRSEEFKWIEITGIIKQTEVSDRYLIVGQMYHRLRDALAKSITDDDANSLKCLIQEVKTTNEDCWEAILQLVVHREITCTSNRHVGQDSRKGLNRLRTYLTSLDIIHNKDFMKNLLDNNIQPNFLQTRSDADLHEQGLQCLLVHFKIVLAVHTGTPGSYTTTIGPFTAIATGNASVHKMFLPTMPQFIEDEYKLLLEKVALYCCPNGHPYTIGDCGKAATKGRCNECGEQIGGANHQLLETNRTCDVNDINKTGHILGRSDEVKIQAVRDLNAIECTVLRLLIHMAMFIGPVEQIQKIIKPAVSKKEVSPFLLHHIRTNIEDLQRAIPLSADDAISLMHAVIHRLMQIKVTNLTKTALLMETTTIRNEWENAFSSTVLRDILGDVNGCVMRINHAIANDKRYGDEQLKRLMNETGIHSETHIPTHLLDVNRLWRFRLPITIEHVSQELKLKIPIMKKPTRILHRFMNEDVELKALRYIPNIMMLHRTLLRTYKRKLDKAEAKGKTAKDVIKDMPNGREIEKWIDDFTKAWEITKRSLKPGIPTKLGQVQLPKELINMRMDQNSPIAVFLPCTNGLGLCSYAMLDFLFEKQNEFLEFYRQQSKRKDQLICVDPKVITASHLISFDHQDDIIPVVLANAQHSLEIGDGTNIEYNFKAIERQIIDRLIYSKSKINIRPFLKIDMMLFKNEMTDARAFQKLKEIIPQELLSRDIRQGICEDLNEIPDICESLSNVDVSIRFLKTTGGEPTLNLSEFMSKTLLQETTILSQKARQCCELRHVKSLWSILSSYKATRIFESSQNISDVFENLPQEYFRDIPESVKQSFDEYMTRLSVEVLSTFLEMLHEFVFLVVSVRQNPNDEDYIDNAHFPLFTSLVEYIASQDSDLLNPAILESSPAEIKYMHCANAWLMLYGALCKKTKSLGQ